MKLILFSVSILERRTAFEDLIRFRECRLCRRKSLGSTGCGAVSMVLERFPFIPGHIHKR